MPSARDFWESLLAKPRSRLDQLLSQVLVGALGFCVSALLVRVLGMYTGATTLVTVILLGLLGEAAPALLLALILTLLCDYFFIPPIGSVFGNAESTEHFLIVSITSIVVSLLVSSLRASYRVSIRAWREAERAKAESEQAKEAMERMLALVTHDVRSPLTAVKVMAEMIVRYKDRPDKHPQLAQRMIGDLERVDAMIRALLDVSRIKSGQPIPLEFKWCDLADIVARSVEGLSLTFGDRFVLSSQGPVFGYWSPDGVRRVIENLAINAVKYGDPKAAIVIGACLVDGHASLSVHNQGKEISAEEQARLFDPYRRGATDTLNAKKRGWGLGLALVKGIAQAHGGEVSIQSAPGKGTSFILELPIRQDPGLLVGKPDSGELYGRT